MFVCFLEFIDCFHLLNFLKYLQERKQRCRILWLDADSYFIFLGRLLHPKDKTWSHKSMLFLGDSSLGAYKRLSKIHKREEWGRVCNKVVYVTWMTNRESCEPLEAPFLWETTSGSWQNSDVLFESWFVQLSQLSSRLLNNVIGFVVTFGKAACQYKYNSFSVWRILGFLRHTWPH